LAGQVQKIGQRIGRNLERRGLLVRDIDDSYLELELARFHGVLSQPAAFART